MTADAGEQVDQTLTSPGAALVMKVMAKRGPHSIYRERIERGFRTCESKTSPRKAEGQEHIEGA